MVISMRLLDIDRRKHNSRILQRSHSGEDNRVSLEVEVLVCPLSRRNEECQGFFCPSEHFDDQSLNEDDIAASSASSESPLIIR